MRGLLLILIVPVILLGVGIGSAYYIISGRPHLISSNPDQLLQCSDSDGDDIYTKGRYNVLNPTSQLEPNEPPQQSNGQDYCDYYHPKAKSRVGLIHEYSCKGTTLKEEVWSCGRGFVCRQSACVEGNAQTGNICYDSDGGQDVRKKGEVEAFDGWESDYCVITTTGLEQDGGGGQECSGSNCYISEAYCDGDLKAKVLKSCFTGCSNGVCNQ